MPSRLKGIETVINRLAISLSKSLFGYAFPFEGNWNCILFKTFPVTYAFFGYAFPFEGNWNSFFQVWCANSELSFGYAFPFEGNWNTNAPVFVSVRKPFVYAFPFEGNWNCFYMHSPRMSRVIATLYMPSRLKGIETIQNVASRRYALLCLCICLPVWRELKLQRMPNPISIQKPFGYAFPFEGNWNMW